MNTDHAKLMVEKFAKKLIKADTTAEAKSEGRICYLKALKMIKKMNREYKVWLEERYSGRLGEL